MYFTGLLIYQAGGAIPWKPSGSEKANIGDENSLGDRKTYSYDLFFFNFTFSIWLSLVKSIFGQVLRDNR